MSSLSHRKRMLALGVLAAGAVASIATSYVHPELSAEEPLPAQIVDGAQPSAGYLIRAQLLGPELEPGDVYIDIGAAFASPLAGPATVAVAIRPAGSTEILDLTELVLDPARAMDDVYAVHAVVFQTCAATPCVDELELWIDRIDGGTSPVTIDGRARIHVETHREDASDGASVTLTVTPLQVP